MSSACTQHSKARSSSESRSGSAYPPYATSRAAERSLSSDSALTSRWLCSRHGRRTERVCGSGEAFHRASVRASGATRWAGVRAPSGSSRPRATATSPSTVIRCPITPATVVRRPTCFSPSNQRSRTGACHSASWMSWSSASSRAVSVSYAAAHSGTGIFGGRRSRQLSRTRARSPGSRSSGSSWWSRPTASRSRWASSAQRAHSGRWLSTAAASSGEQAESAQAPRYDMRARWSTSSRVAVISHRRRRTVRPAAGAPRRWPASGGPAAACGVPPPR